MFNRITTNSFWIILNSLVFVSCSSYNVNLWNDGPIVKGGTITFTAAVFENGQIASGSFKYDWSDNAIPEHTATIESKSSINTWSVTYNASIYPQGPYLAQVKVEKCILNVYCYEVTSNRILFNVTDSLNGYIELSQKNVTRNTTYVSSADTVVHKIALKPTDADFIKGASTVLTYWFVDCTYYGFGRDMNFSFNYSHPDEQHQIEALVVADFNPIPTPAPTTTMRPKTTTVSTTTVKPTATTSKSTTTTKTTTPAPKSTTTKFTTTKPTTTTTKKSIAKRSIAAAPNNSTQIMVKVNGTLVAYNGTFPYVCNSTIVATDSGKTYGYFSRMISVKEPVAKVNVTGNNWLQHGELLTLNVKCHGSKNLQYCVQYEKGIYNITGNESCSYYHQLETCEFTIQRYLIESTEYTIVIITENEVSKVVTPVTVTVYKVKRQAQLSVIVVPVVFSIIAIVSIFFGLAYYIQNRSRFVVEVADFNFGQKYSDMEYKTFRERLRDSIANAFFTRAPSPGSSEVPVWPPGRKYGSMTS